MGKGKKPKKKIKYLKLPKSMERNPLWWIRAKHELRLVLLEAGFYQAMR